MSKNNQSNNVPALDSDTMTNLQLLEMAGKMVNKKGKDLLDHLNKMINVANTLEDEKPRKKLLKGLNEKRRETEMAISRNKNNTNKEGLVKKATNTALAGVSLAKTGVVLAAKKTGGFFVSLWNSVKKATTWVSKKLFGELSDEEKKSKKDHPLMWQTTQAVTRIKEIAKNILLLAKNSAMAVKTYVTLHLVALHVAAQKTFSMTKKLFAKKQNVAQLAQ